MNQQSGHDTNGTADNAVRLDAVLLEEMKALRPDETIPEQLERGQLNKLIDKFQVPLSALCLSGGGIRSASFALGVIQGFARFGLLGKFDYLSTVSGGGYIGSWLTAWRYHAKDDQKVFTSLDRTVSESGDEAAEIQGLRANSNYITPKLGLLSADTWTAVALTIRNLVLNWLVFLPFFMGVLYSPWLSYDLLRAAKFWSGAVPLLMLLGVALTTAGLTAASYGRRLATRPWLTNRRFVLLVLCPIVSASIAFATGLAALVEPEPSLPLPSLWVGVFSGAGCYAAAWLLASVFLADRKGHAGGWSDLDDLVSWVVAGAISGSLLTLGMHLGGMLGPAYKPEILVVLGSSWTMLSIFGGELIYVGLRSYAVRGDMDREWLGRAAGWLTAGALSWAALAGVALFGVHALKNGTALAIAGMAVGGASGLTALGLAGSAKTVATVAAAASKRLSLSQITNLAGVIFAIFLAICLSLVDAQLSGMAEATFPILANSWIVDAAGFALLILLSAGISWFVNINRFSLHSLYRNRLVNAFLGSARATAVPPRDPDPFTGFDQADNPRMAQLPTRKLLHVVNLTLNVVSTRNLAWQERKAEPFTVTPFAAGNPTVGYRATKIYGDENGGMTLGTAMAISGAAVSPNMGYHSSPLLGFLLMLFNVRLGWWLGNPQGTSYRRQGPKFSIVPLLEELASQTTDRGRWVYLSDGGHFENLGLYEMIRRRCRLIVVSDAGQDPKCAIEDLGNAVRKIYIDQGVSIDFETLSLDPRETPPKSGSYCAVGRITYPGCELQGWLLYIKPGYHGTEPAQIRSYATIHADFPHESTTNQWFSESQFEAYRALGAHIAELICGGGHSFCPAVRPPEMGLQDLKRRVEEYLARAAGFPADQTAAMRGERDLPL
jgi:hypothetical protein